MDNPIVIVVAALAGMIGAMLLVLGAFGGMRAFRRFDAGVLYAYFPLTQLSGAVVILFSSRDFGLTNLLTSNEQTAKSALAVWALRMTSVFTLVASFDTIVRRFRSSEPLGAMRLWLALAFAYFWLTTVASPGFLGTRVVFEHSYTYSLLLGVGLILMTQGGADLAIRLCRETSVVICILSFLAIPVIPNLVLDRSYAQGLLPGIPRLAGLASHAIGLATMASIGILTILYLPYRKPWLRHAALAVCALALFLAQSKALWFNLAVVLPLMLLCSAQVPGWNDPRQAKHGGVLFALVAAGLLVTVLGVVLMSPQLGPAFERFLSSSEGNQLTTMTGRDKIWAVALDEWSQHPVFGYGLGLFDLAYRMSVGMLFATHGHNQAVDTLARCGLVGLSGLLFYVSCLGYLSFRYARASRGLSLALFVSLFLRGVSEVPLSLVSIGAEAIPHLLLLVVLTRYAGQVEVRRPLPPSAKAWQPA